MCERKPGPRCSADTMRNLRNLNVQLASVNDRAAEALAVAEDFKRSNQSYYDTDEYEHYEYEVLFEDYRDCVVERQKLERKVEVASAEYDATPEGLESVRRLVATVGNAVEVYSFGAMTHEENFQLDYGTETPEFHKVKVSVPKVIFLKKRLERASSHREWQKSTLRALEDFEREAPAKALFFAQGLSSALKAEQTALEASMPYRSGDDHPVFVNYRLDPSEENKKKAVELISKKNDVLLKLRYNALKQGGLRSYVDVEEAAVGKSVDSKVKANLAVQ